MVKMGVKNFPRKEKRGTRKVKGRGEKHNEEQENKKKKTNSHTTIKTNNQQDAI